MGQKLDCDCDKPSIKDTTGTSMYHRYIKDTIGTSMYHRYIKDTTGTSMHASNLDICLKFTVRDDEEGLLIA